MTPELDLISNVDCLEGMRLMPDGFEIDPGYCDTARMRVVKELKTPWL